MQKWLKIAIAIFIHILPQLYVAVLYHPTSADRALMASNFLKITMMKTVPFTAILPVFYFLSTRFHSAIQYVSAAACGYGAFRNIYYYFISQYIGDFLGGVLALVGARAYLPACTAAHGCSLIADAYVDNNMLALLRDDGIWIQVSGLVMVAIEGGRRLRAAEAVQWLLATLLIGFDVTAPLFILRLLPIELAEQQGKDKDKDKARPAKHTLFSNSFAWLYFLIAAASLYPWIKAVYKHNVLDKGEIGGIYELASRTEIGARLVITITVTFFSFVAWSLPQVRDSDGNTALTWLWRYVLYHAYLSHIGAALAMFLFYRELTPNKSFAKHDHDDAPTTRENSASTKTKAH